MCNSNMFRTLPLDCSPPPAAMNTGLLWRPPQPRHMKAAGGFCSVFCVWCFSREHMGCDMSLFCSAARLRQTFRRGGQGEMCFHLQLQKEKKPLVVNLYAIFFICVKEKILFVLFYLCYTVASGFLVAFQKQDLCNQILWCSVCKRDILSVLCPAIVLWSISDRLKHYAMTSADVYVQTDVKQTNSSVQFFMFCYRNPLFLLVLIIQLIRKYAGFPPNFVCLFFLLLSS